MQGTLKIHSENILPIIKKWLYSDKDIFVRELVSNACDAIRKLSILQENKEASTDSDPFRIDVTIDAAKKRVTISDNGLGMDADEVEKYIAQIAFSGAEEFVSKYTSQKEDDQIIGHFGLGFFSAYMVAEKVEIQTLSYKQHAEPVFWSCDGSSSYLIEKGTRTTRGTEVILTIAKEEEEYLEVSRLRQLLSYYCGFLPYSIYLNGTLINEKPPLWMKPASECTEQEYLNFYHLLFPGEQDPLFWVHLNVDYPFHLKGILYFPQLSKERELKKEAIKLFCNRVFVSDHCKDLFPDYLMVLRGAIDSPDIPLNVSRSYLQMDKTIKQLGSHLSKKISDKLSSLYTSQRQEFLDYWPDIELIIKYGALQDEKFYDRVKEFLVWKNSRQEWTTLQEYLERNQPKTEQKVFYTTPETAQSACLDLYSSKNVEVLFVASTMIDQALIQLLERKTSAKFERIDASLNETILDPAKEKNLLDADGKSESSRIAEFFRKKLQIEHLDVEAKSLASNSVPALILMKEDQRRLRDTLAYYKNDLHAISHAAFKPTFVVNTNHRLIQALQKIDSQNPTLANEMIHALYDHTRISQQDVDPEILSNFLKRNMTIMETFADTWLKKL